MTASYRSPVVVTGTISAPATEGRLTGPVTRVTLTRRCLNQDILLLLPAHDRLLEGTCCSHRHQIRARNRRQAVRASDKGNPRPPHDCCPRDGIAHFSAGTVGDKPHRVKGFPRRT